jgi:hypothetical protein
MATNFMAAYRMRILRLFINDNLESSINWSLINNDNNTEKGSSTWGELAMFENVQLEVYLNAHCCSILKTDVKGISTKRLTEELVLGMLEESIADDIEEIKPIILRIEDETAYIAIFSRAFYDNLMTKLDNMSKSIRFIQSFAYSTAFTEDNWTLFISEEQRFVRTSKYEYFSLDNKDPIPTLLKDMLLEHTPQSLSIYTSNPDILKIITEEFNVPCNIATELTFGVLNWNFYNQKSTHFKIKLDETTKTNLNKSYKLARIFAIILISLWIINIIRIGINNIKSGSQIKANLQAIQPITTINKNTLQNVENKIQSMRHERGIYDSADAIPMFSNFLEIVSTAGTNSIIQINYEHKALEIVLNNNFDTTQFSSYQNILATKNIKAVIESYKTHLSDIKKSGNNNDKDNQPDNQAQRLDDAAWVITLQPSLMLETRGKN